MKRTPLKRIGKRGRVNLKANQILKKLYEDIPRICELRFEGCAGGLFLGFAHRHERDWYYKTPELLSKFNQTILACSGCHQKMDDDKELREQVFIRLRGNEEA